MTADADALLNVRTVSELRVQAGLSRRSLARQIGVSETVIRGLENGYNHDALTLAAVHRLATALATTPAHLLTPDNGRRPLAEDDVLVESALATLHRSVPAHDIATALGWTLERTNAALLTLQQRLNGTGQALVLDQWNKARLVPAPGPTPAQQLALHQLSPRQRGLTPSTARVLRDFLLGRLDSDWHQRASRTDRDGLSSLLNQGILEIRHDENAQRVVLANDYAYLANPPNRTNHDAATEPFMTLHTRPVWRHALSVVASRNRRVQRH